MESILLYGRTNSGKTSLIGELALDIYKRTGKTTILNSSDEGGWGPITPLVDLGIIKVFPMGDVSPWVYLHQTASGKALTVDANHPAVPDKWVDVDFSNVGLVANDSVTSIAEAMLEDLAERTAHGLNIAGGGNANFNLTENGVSLKIGSNNMSHYGVIQTRVRKEVRLSKRLPVDHVLWTAGIDQGSDDVSTKKVVGPAVIGHAMTGTFPRLFDFTFRLDVLPAKGAAPERHQLYIGTHTDVTLANAAGLGNSRLPLGSKLPKTIVEPASVVEALSMIDRAKEEVIERLKKS